MLALTIQNNNRERIGREELEVLNDIKNRCFWATPKDRARFVSIVSRSVNAPDFPSIYEDDFETAFNVAMTLLRNRGEEILRGQHDGENLAFRKAY